MEQDFREYFDEYSKKEKLLENMLENLEIRGHHLSSLATVYFCSKYDRLNEIIGDPTAIEFIIIFEKFVTQLDSKVKIVEGIDSICKADCPNLNSSCLTSGDEDMHTLKCYSLKIGKTYKAKEIIKKINNFEKKTGFKSPREEKTFNKFIKKGGTVKLREYIKNERLVSPEQNFFENPNEKEKFDYVTGDMSTTKLLKYLTKKRKLYKYKIKK